MSVIVSRFVGKCVKCGVRIPAGSKVNWTKGVKGVSHADGCVPVTFEARSKATNREEARIYFEEDTKVLNKAGKWVGIIEQVANKSVRESKQSVCGTCNDRGCAECDTKVLDPAYGPTNGLNGLPPQYLPSCTRNPCKGCNVCNEDGDGSESEIPDIAF
jgi:hypothetical protein